MNTDVEVLHEEIIVLPTAEKVSRGLWKGEAQIMGKVEIEGKVYVFERYVRITFTKE